MTGGRADLGERADGVLDVADLLNFHAHLVAHLEPPWRIHRRGHLDAQGDVGFGIPSFHAYMEDRLERSRRVRGRPPYT